MLAYLSVSAPAASYGIRNGMLPSPKLISAHAMSSRPPFPCAVFQREFDWLASVTYGGLVVLEAGIFLAAAILNPRAKRRSVRDGEHVDTAEGPDMSQTGSRLGPSDPEASQVADSALPSAAASSENDTSTSMDAEHHHRLPPV